MSFNITQRRASGTVVYRTYWDPQTGVEQFGLHSEPSSDVLFGYLDRPTTVRRPKPSDLRRAWTPRAVEGWLTQYDSVQYHRNAAGDMIWYNVPASYWTGIPQPPGFNNLMAEVNDFSALDGRIRARIKNSSANLAQNLAEFRQTSSMFVRAARDVVIAFSALRHGQVLANFVRELQRPRSAKAKTAADRWLEYQYGLRPLIQDIYDSAETLAARVRRGITYYSGTKVERDVQLPHGITLCDSDNWDFSLSQKLKVSWDYDESSLVELSQFGITNPALVVWELIPYSFIADQLIPIGNFLSSLDALAGVHNLQVYRSYQIKGTLKTRLNVGSGAKMSAQYWRTERLPVSSTLALPPIRYQPSDNLKAVVNNLALLTQLFVKGRKK